MSIPSAALHIGLHRSSQRPLEGTHEINVIRGGPDQLLAWLEAQLGLNGPPVAFTDRVVDYRRRLAAADGPAYKASMAQDAWATAAELLRRRDGLLMAGWKPAESGALPRLVRDLAATEATNLSFRPGLPERLDVVQAALDAGLILPDHRIHLEEPAAAWPAKWAPILARLSVDIEPHTERELSWAQAETLETRSRHSAVNTLVAFIHHQGEAAKSTCIVSADSVAAHMADSALAAHGLPTIGAAIDGRSQPSLQVLPLALELCWTPVNPYALLDLLVLPLSPIPRKAAFRLARALAEQPGFGSDEWTRAWARLTDPAQDTDGKIGKRLNDWLAIQRVPRGESLPTSLVRQVCARTAQWAAGRAELLLKDAADDPVAASLQAAAAQAKALAELASTYGATIPANQIERLLHEVSNSQSRVVPHIPQSGGAVLVGDLADVPDGIETVVLFGTAAPTLAQSHWTLGEQRALHAAGVRIDDTTATAGSWLRACTRGLAKPKRLLVLRFPQGEGATSHPLWLQISSKLSKPLVAEDILGQPGCPTWLAAKSAPLQLLTPSNGLWQVPPEAIPVTTTENFGSLEAKLACPAKWVLTFAADIQPGPAADIPPDHRLMGVLGHKLFELVFPVGPAPTPAEAAQRMRNVFEDTVERNAAPLAQARKLREKQQLLHDLVRSAEVFADALQRGGYRIVGMEQSFETPVDGRVLRGRIDCVVANDHGEAVVDFKFAGRNKYPKKLRTGTAVQLALYGTARGQQTGTPVHAAAYYILQDSMLATPRDEPMAGSLAHEQVQGPSIGDTWTAFSEALANAGAWLTTGDLPMRPLQPPASWPRGTELAIDEGDPPECCKYCNFQALCGRVVLE